MRMGSRRELPTELLAVVPVTQSIGVVIPGSIHTTRQEKVANEYRATHIRAITSRIGLTVPLVCRTEEHMIGGLAVVPGLRSHSLHQVRVGKAARVGSEPAESCPVGLVRKPVLIVVGIEVHRDTPLPLVAAAQGLNGRRSGPSECRQEHTRQNGDDHQQLNEREGGRSGGRIPAGSHCEALIHLAPKERQW